MLGGDDLPAERQLAFVQGLLAPLVQQIKSNTEAAASGGVSEAQMVQHALVAIQHMAKVWRSPKHSSTPLSQRPGQKTLHSQKQLTQAQSALFQGFTHQTATISRPGIGELFLRVLDASLQVPLAAPRNKGMRARVLALLHRLVEVLGSTLVPYMPRALETLLFDGMDAQDTADVLVLFVQLICRLKVLHLSIAFAFLLHRRLECTT